MGNDLAKVKETLLRLEFLAENMKTRPSDYSFDPRKVANLGIFIQSAVKLLRQYVESGKISESTKNEFNKCVTLMEAMW